jgi:hypothetical protein
VKDHLFGWGYTWTKRFLHSRGLLEKAKRRGAHRRKRERRPLPGMMLHQDASTHVWLAGQPALDLVVTMDDATNAILSAFLAPEEGHSLDIPGPGGGVWPAWSPAELLYRSGQPLFLHAGGGREGRSHASGGWPGNLLAFCS